MLHSFLCADGRELAVEAVKLTLLQEKGQTATGGVQVEVEVAVV